jgi:hypothetical protein
MNSGSGVAQADDALVFSATFALTLAVAFAYGIYRKHRVPMTSLKPQTTFMCIYISIYRVDCRAKERIVEIETAKQGHTYVSLHAVCTFRAVQLLLRIASRFIAHRNLVCSVGS